MSRPKSSRFSIGVTGVFLLGFVLTGIVSWVPLFHMDGLVGFALWYNLLFMGVLCLNANIVNKTLWSTEARQRALGRFLWTADIQKAVNKMLGEKAVKVQRALDQLRTLELGGLHALGESTNTDYSAIRLELEGELRRALALFNADWDDAKLLTSAQTSLKVGPKDHTHYLPPGPSSGTLSD